MIIHKNLSPLLYTIINHVVLHYQTNMVMTVLMNFVKYIKKMLKNNKFQTKRNESIDCRRIRLYMDAKVRYLRNKI